MELIFSGLRESEDFSVEDVGDNETIASLAMACGDAKVLPSDTVVVPLGSTLAFFLLRECMLEIPNTGAASQNNSEWTSINYSEL